MLRKMWVNGRTGIGCGAARMRVAAVGIEVVVHKTLVGSMSKGKRKTMKMWLIVRLELGMWVWLVMVKLRRPLGLLLSLIRGRKPVHIIRLLVRIPALLLLAKLHLQLGLLLHAKL